VLRRYARGYTTYGPLTSSRARPKRRACGDLPPSAAGRSGRRRFGPGDYVFVPPYVPHREENPDQDHPAVIVIARSTQEAIVVNLPGALSDPREEPID
jgi:hypothetical protein